MHQLTSAAVGLVPSAESLRTLFGTALDKNDDSGIALSNLALWLQSQVAFSQQVELQCTEIVRSYNPANNLMLRVGFIRLTSKMELDRNNVWWVGKIHANIRHISELYIGTRKLIYGIDFDLKNQRLHIFDDSLELAGATGFIAGGIALNTFIQERLNASLFGISDFESGSVEFYAAMKRSLRDGLTRATLADLVCSAIGCEYVRKDSVVTAVIEKAGFSPLVITEAESIRGLPGDTPLVSVGDTVRTGDLIFSTVRIWDCQEPRPADFTSLSIPKTILKFQSQGPVTVTSTPAAATTVVVRNKLRVRYPITGATADQTAYWNAQDEAEDASGAYLANYLANSSTPTAAYITGRQYDWLDVLWQTWLRFGALVVKVSYPDARRLTPVQHARLQQIRRCVPPWMAYIIQAEVDPEYAC